MKVTVCFSDIKVVVPCGDGSGLVKDLLEEAITRYRKAQAKSSDACWLDLNTVKLLLCDGGILDLDDKITDVIDDKEQIQAVVDGNNNGSLQEHNDSGGDGMSGSSLGTYSPDIFRDNLSERLCNGKEASGLLADGCHDVIITEQDFLAESGLRVRRGSEPTLYASSDLDSSGVELSAEYPIYGAIKKKNAGDRQEPLGSILKNGQSGNSGHVVAVKPTVNTNAKISKEQEHEQSDEEMIVVLPKSKEALGIHVIPEFDQSGRNIGLTIEKIERGGRADRDRRLLKGDKIVEINFQNLFQVDFPKAQDIFRAAFLAPELQIRLLRPSKQSVKNSTEDKGQSNSVSVSDRFEQKHLDATKRIPPAVPARSPKTQLTSKPPARLTMQAIPIELIKGADGLGFSVTTHGIRDSSCCPIYIKQIFSVGAAIEDGRLKPGDVLLEINGTSLANKTKADAARLLRNLPTGSTVQLLVSRALSIDETALQKQNEVDGRPASQHPRSTTGRHSTSASSCSDRTEEEEDKEAEDLGAKENATGRRKFGSMSNIAKSVSSDDFDNEADHELALNLQTGGHSADKMGTLSTLQKSRKSISMDDLRQNARSGVEVSFDDDVDFAVAPFNKMRDFNQSFRAAVIDKTYNKPPTDGGTKSVEYIAAIEKLERLEKLEKLRMNGDKKSKSKKDQGGGGGSGRKFGWLFRFGKGRKSDSESNRATPPQAASSRNAGDRMAKPPPEEKLSANDGLPVTIPTNVSLHQPTSHPSVHSHYSSEPFRETDGGLVRLQKEDYMISSSDHSRQVASNQDRSQIYTKHTNTDFVYNEPQSYRHRQELDYQRYEQSRQHEGMLDRYDVSKQQFLHPPTSHRYQQSPLIGSSNVYLNQMYRETSAPSQQFRHQGIPPSGGDGKPPFKYHHDNYPGLRPYKTDFYPEQRSRYVNPGAGEQLPLPSSTRTGHYYRQENFHGQDPVNYQNFHQRHNPYFQDPAYDQRPLDLSQHAVRAHGRADVGYGHESREHGLQNRQIPNQQTSIYPPYKDVSPGGLKASPADMAREQAMQRHMKTRAMPEQRQYDDYQARLRQNNQTFITERW